MFAPSVGTRLTGVVLARDVSSGLEDWRIGGQGGKSLRNRAGAFSRRPREASRYLLSGGTEGRREGKGGN